MIQRNPTYLSGDSELFQTCTATLNLSREPVSKNANVQISWTKPLTDFTLPTR